MQQLNHGANGADLLRKGIILARELIVLLFFVQTDEKMAFGVPLMSTSMAFPLTCL